MQSGFLQDVVIGQVAALLEVTLIEGQPLLIWGNAFLVLNFGLDTFDGVRRVDLQGDGLAGESLDKDFHWKHQVQSAFCIERNKLTI